MRFSLPALALLVACASAPPPQAARSTVEGSVDGERSAYRRAVGGLGAGYLFQAHLALGTTADLLGKEVYDSGEVEALMDTTISMTKSVADMLGEIRKLEIGPGDHKTIGHMIEVNRLLGAQAVALKTFARERTESNALRFQEHRRSTWTELSQLLDIRPHE
jgi:hypothetical protein